MIDSHCHLTDKKFNPDREEVIKRAKERGVETIITISDELSDIPKCRKLSEEHENIYYTAGVHPHHADSFSDEALEIVRSSLSDEKCKSVGEIGLDYHYMNSPKEKQQEVFEKQLSLAKELDVPSVVHCRDAVDDLWTIVNHVGPPRIVIHCCTEEWKDVERFIEAGHYLSFTGIATYKNSDVIRETIKHCPIERLMIETDAPYLTPEPHRGKRNEPAFVAEVLKTIASTKGLSEEEVEKRTTENTYTFFALS